MVIEKENQQVQIPIQIEKADKFVSRFTGLMFRKKLPENKALLLVPCKSIHMFFMRFPIDVMFLDKNNRVVKIVENLRPWSLVPPVRSAHSTLELPVGAIRRHGIQVGDRVGFESLA
ncbi:DUF192 domain-containing protein [Effusibacillus consociatus]|uniref:DUF192 domain-containing protein n=1 Tax=Effusibacillus consociatus TaxID=1117041 RepID=A0ABV9Q2E9_9BACL